ncbi:MAG TPA: LON peptidase substrate-binding domain-containing protein [Chitinophagales bacterium]|nr:LON peptidase substrate-binding domain-containing protein [Chitinophagales bacterium]
MTKYLPIFPLNLVVYPGQQLNLHIFEPRYKQLIAECRDERKTFGIPSVFKESLNEYGTEMELLEVTKVYDTGEMDIMTRGIRIFRIMEVLREVPEKLYSAAVVYEVEHLPFDTEVLNPTLVDLLKRLHELMGTNLDVYTKFENPLSFDIAPYVALSPEDQYRMLAAPSEKGRQWFIIQHLMKLIPMLEETEQVKAKVKMNGHFRHEMPPRF